VGRRECLSSRSALPKEDIRPGTSPSGMLKDRQQINCGRPFQRRYARRGNQQAAKSRLARITPRDASSLRSTVAQVYESHPRAEAAGRVTGKEVGTEADTRPPARATAAGTEAGITTAGRSGGIPDGAGTTALLSNRPRTAVLYSRRTGVLCNHRTGVLYNHRTAFLRREAAAV
jgi:hypothetical protein